MPLCGGAGGESPHTNQKYLNLDEKFDTDVELGRDSHAWDPGDQKTSGPLAANTFHV